VTRDIIAKHGGYGLSDCTMEDKLDFVKLLKEKRRGNEIQSKRE
jgi:hypothetical protein